MKIPQDVHVDNVFFCQNPVENCSQILPRCDVNREKSDVMTSLGLIDRSAVFCVNMRVGFYIVRKYWMLYMI
jgi:hypothetical protein